MATLSLKISLDGGRVVKTMQFDPSTTVHDACAVIREKILEASVGEPKDYGLFLTSDEDTRKGIWLEPSRTLEHYILRNGDTLEFNKKMRNLRVRMLDGSVKTLLVDDSQIVANLMVVICTRIGITNYDEYGLVREEHKDEQDSNDKPNFGTLTLRRKNPERERDAKMEQLRKKLKTDDEVNWVDPALTLREQGVDAAETLLLRRKFFFSDRNVDSRDPVQLGLLYVQARDAILDGTHPVTQEKACEFAGIQCQIQFGDHKDEKHIAGFLDPKEFLPASYAKVKGIDKKVFKEHRKHIGLSELDAKVLYTKTARALPTYGVAFFLVKEKMKAKNKLVPRLLGVSKDSVLRLDEKTKDILQTWPLTTVRRWCGSPNTFTLDFGDYSDQYYSVQTTEAEQILTVIAGYIDIILKKQKAKERFGIEGDEGSAMLEDVCSPNKAQILQHEITNVNANKVVPESVALPAVVRPGGDGGKSFVVSHTSSAIQTTTSGKITIGHPPPAGSMQVKTTTVVSEPQRALLTTISSGREMIRETEMHLTRAELPAELGHDAASLRWKETQLDTSRQAVTTHIAAMNAATAQVVTLTSGPTEEVDHTAVGAAITTITTNLPEMTKGVQMLAALMEDDGNGDKLLDATRKLCSAFSDLLKAAEPEAKETRQNLLNAASRVGEASTKVLYTIGEETEENKEVQDILLALAKAVANTTAALVLKAKNVAATCKDDQAAQNRVIAAATQCALATSQLVACAKVVAPTLQNPACRSQLVEAARAVARAVEALSEQCRLLGGHDELRAAAAEVTAALRDMLDHVEQCDHRAHQSTGRDSVVDTVMAASEQLMTSQDDSSEMVKRARVLGQATAQLITDIKTEAEQNPQSEQQRRLLAAAKLLADATARMVEAARQCASSPQDRGKQEALRKAAEELRFITVDYVQGQDLAETQVHRLKEAAREATSSGAQLVASANNAGVYNTSRHSQEVLSHECRTLQEAAPELMEAVKVCNVRPGQAAAQLQLIRASETFLEQSGHASQAARAVLPTVTDAASAKQLADTTHQFSSSCTELRAAVNRARLSCKGLEVDAAAEVIVSLQRELDDAEEAMRAFDLKPLPGETAEWAAQHLSTASRNTASSVARLVSSVRHADAAGGAAACGLAARGLRDFTSGVRAVAAAGGGQRVIDSGRQVLSSSLMLVETVKRCFTTTERIDTTTVVDIAKEISQRLEQTAEAVPSHRELDAAIENINDTLNVLNMGEFPHSDRSYSSLQQEVHAAADGLAAESSRVVEAVGRAAQLADASGGFNDAFDRLVGVGAELCGRCEDSESRAHMVQSLRGVTTSCARLLGTARSVGADAGQPNARNRLAAAARAVTDELNRMMDSTLCAPGHAECAKAARSIRSTLPLLNSVSEPLGERGYYACLDEIVAQSKTLSEGMSGMAHAAKHSDHEQFVRSVRAVADAICGLVECTAQSAYLVGVSHETSVAGRPGLVDQAQFARAAHAIERACDQLAEPSSDQHQVLSAATVIAKHTSALCNACRVASGKTPSAQAKRHFVQAAKDVANSTAALVKEIKALDSDYSETNRGRCAEATGPLLDAVRGLCQFANSPEFASVPARISQAGRAAQAPILDSGRSIVRGSCSMVESAKVLVGSPGDKTEWQNLATHSKTVSDSIKSLVSNMRDKAPGQHECLSAIETLNSHLRELDQASLQSEQGDLAPRKGNSLQGYSEQIENAASEMQERLEPLRVAACGEAENLGHAVTQLVSYAAPLVQAAVGAASNLSESSVRHSVLEQSKTVVEGLTQLALASKDAGGNPRATSIHPEVEEGVRNCRSSLRELSSSVRRVCTQNGLVAGLLDSMARSVARVTEHRMSLLGYDEADSFVDYQTRMVGAAKEIARLATEMTSKAATDASRLAPLGGEAAQRYEQLAADSVGAAATTANGDVAHRIRSSVVECGEGVTQLIKAGGRCQLSADSAAQRAVADAARAVNEKVGSVLAALQAGSRGTQACIDAAATVSAIIGDLDTTILFASAGTLHAESEQDTFSEHRESILKTAKTLVEDTKTLVGGAAGSQDQLAEAARASVTTIVQLAEIVKLGAMSLGSSDPDSQVMLIHAVRDVAAALRDLIHATKDASGKHMTHPHMTRLKDSAKVMVTNVTSLLKTVKAVEDEHTRGTSALESAIEAISQEIRVLLSPAAPRATCSPEELVRATRQMTGATARAVAAGNSARQDDIVVAANAGRKAVSDLLAVCKGAAYAAETPELRERTVRAGHEAAAAHRALLQAVLAGQRPAAELSRRIAQCVADIIAVAELLKGSDWVDPDDPTVVAENELLGAAASIDAAANKLAALRPRKRSTREADETLNFDEMILEAAKSIIAATSALVRAASAAQRELIDQGKVTRRPASSSDDGQWSEGLVSAARMVAAAAHSLVEAANALVQGLGSEEKLISAAKQVASSTAHLLIACKVKADPSSESYRRLQAAGGEVIRSTDNLVRSARESISVEEDRCLVLNTRVVGGIKQEIDARSEVLRIEKELEEARNRLKVIRIERERQKGGESGSETDRDAGHASDASGHRFGWQSQGLNNSFGANSSFGPNTTYSPNSSYGPNSTGHTLNSTSYTQNTSNIGQNTSHFGQNTSNFGQNTSNFSQNTSNFGQNTTNFGQNTSNFSQNTSNFGQTAKPDLSQHTTNLSQNIQQLNKSIYGTTQPKSPVERTVEESQAGQRSSFTSFRPTSTEDTPRNYEGFTTRYETRLFDTPRAPAPPPPTYMKTEESHFQTESRFREQKSAFEGPKVASPLSPKFNARFDLKFDQKSPDPVYSTIKRTPGDGIRDNFTETKKSTENIPGGKIESEYTMKSESYQSYPQEFHRVESRNVASPFTTSTPSKNLLSTDLVKAATPEFKERIASPYGKEVASFGGPNYSEESSTEVKEIPNGTQRITTTKIYSSSPVTITSTNTKYDPIKLDGIDELTKSFESDSKYSTLDSRYDSKFNTLDSKLSSDTSRSFMRPSDFQSEFQTTSVSKVKKPADLAKEIDSVDRKLSKTISKETLERKTVMTSSHKSETSSTVTKKFGNF